MCYKISLLSLTALAILMHLIITSSQVRCVTNSAEQMTEYISRPELCNYIFFKKLADTLNSATVASLHSAYTLSLVRF